MEGYAKAKMVELPPDTNTARLTSNTSSYGPAKFSGVYFLANGLLEKIMDCVREDQPVTFTIPSTWDWHQEIACFVIDGEGYTGDNHGQITISFSPQSTEVQAVDSGKQPGGFHLHQNHPNPFNPVTSIEYSVPNVSEVTLQIYNQLGQKIRTLVHETKSAGEYTSIWDGKDDKGNPVASGIYFYQLQAGNLVATKKMIKLE